MAELKPCPFCGGEAAVYWHCRIVKHKAAQTHYRCGCKECGLRFPKYSGTGEEAIEAWNRRAEDGK